MSSVNGSDWVYDACVSFKTSTAYGRIVGFKLAGDLLLRSVQENPHTSDLLIFPIAFNYLQYVELTLKDLIHRGRLLLGAKAADVSRDDLSLLWLECRTILSQVSPNSAATRLDQIQPLIHDFRHLVETPEPDLKQLYSVTDQLAEVLDGCSFEISNLLDLQTVPDPI